MPSRSSSSSPPRINTASTRLPTNEARPINTTAAKPKMYAARPINWSATIFADDRKEILSPAAIVQIVNHDVSIRAMTKSKRFLFIFISFLLGKLAYTIDVVKLRNFVFWAILLFILYLSYS